MGKHARARICTIGLACETSPSNRLDGFNFDHATDLNKETKKGQYYIYSLKIKSQHQLAAEKAEICNETTTDNSSRSSPTYV